MWNYKNWLIDALYHIAQDLFTDFNYNIDAYDEEEWGKTNEVKGDTIIILIKHLTNSVVFGAKVSPLQFYVVSEGNGLEIARLIFIRFAETYNYYQQTIPNDTLFVKHTYTEPSVLSNFTVIGGSMRSALFVSASLITIENIAEVSDFKIDNEALDVITFQFGYTMIPDIQSFGGEFAITEKSQAHLDYTLTTPCVSNTFIGNVLAIMSGTKSGNTTFTTTFNISNVSFSLPVKIISIHFVSTPDNLPAIQIGFSV